MSDFLPPVVVELGANFAEFTAGFEASVSSLRAFGTAAEETAVLAAEAFTAIGDASRLMAESVTASSDAAKAGIRAVASAARALTTAVDGLAATAPQQFGAVASASTAMAAELDTAFGDMVAAARSVDAALTGVGTAATDMAASASVADAKLVTAAEEAATGVSVAADRTEASMGRMDLATSGAFAGTAEGLKTYAAGVGLVGGAFIFEAVKGASAFQAEMVKVNTQAGVSKDQIAGLSNSVLTLAGQVGFNPTSLAEGLFHVESSFASTGITGAKALEILKVGAEGAAVGHSDLVETVNALDATVAAGIPGVDNFTQAMGALNAIVGSGDMSMQDLTKAFGAGGGLAVIKGYGLTIQDVGAGLATFGDNNLRGAASMTNLRMAVQALAVPAKSAGSLLKEFGMTSQTLADDMQKGGLKLALDDLNDRFKKAGVSATEQGQVITEMFGKKAGAGVALLMGQYDRTISKYPELAKGATTFGDAWTTTTQNFSQQMNDMKASLEALGIKIGTALMPYVERFFGWVKDGIGWLTAHKGAVEALAGAIGGLLVGAILAIGMAIEMTPIGWITTAVMAFGAAVTYAYTHSKIFREIVSDLGRVLSGAFAAAMREVSRLIDLFRADVLPLLRRAIQDVIDWFVSHKEDFKHAWESLLLGIHLQIQWFVTVALPYLREKTHELIDWFVAHKEQFKQAWESLLHGTYDTIKWFVTVALPWLKDHIVAVIDWFIAHKEDFKHAWDTVFKDVKALTEWFNEHVILWVKARIDEFIAWWHDHSTEISTTWADIWAVAKTVFQAWWNAVSTILTIVGAIFTFWWNFLKDITKIAWDNIAGFAATGIHAVEDVIAIVMDIISGNWGKAWSDAKDLVSQTFSDITQTIENLTSDFGSLLYDAGANLIDGLISGIKSSIGSLKSTVSSITGTISGFFNHSPAKEGPLSGTGGPDYSGAAFGRMLAGGIESTTGTVAAASKRLAGAAGLTGSSFLTSGLPLAPAGSGASAPVVNNYITVQGSVLSELDLRNVVQQQMLRLGMNNSQTWQAYQRR